jgi:hypothetical protein
MDVEASPLFDAELAAFMQGGISLNVAACGIDQLKGGDAVVDAACADDIATAARYRDAFAAHLDPLGHLPAMVHALLHCPDSDLWAALYARRRLLANARRRSRASAGDRAMTLTLDAIRGCFEGVIPGTMATADADGTPNGSYALWMRW